MENEELTKRLYPIIAKYIKHLESENEKDTAFTQIPVTKEFFNEILPLIIEYMKRDIEGLAFAMKVATIAHGKTSKEYTIVNAILFFKMSFLDICFLQKEITKAKDIFERGVYAKTTAAHLYEFFDDIPRVYGKKFREAIVPLNDKVIEQQLNNLTSILKKVKEPVLARLRRIRNCLRI